MTDNFLDQDLIEDFFYMLTEEENEDFLFKYAGSLRRYRFKSLDHALEACPDKPLIVHAHFDKTTGDLIGCMEITNKNNRPF